MAWAARPATALIYGVRLRRACGAGKLRSRAHGGIPVKARRHRLGSDFWQAGRALVSYWRHLLRAFSDDAGSYPGSHASSEAERHGRFLRPELPCIVVEI